MLKTLHWLFISSWIKTKSLNMAYKPQAGCHLPSFLTSLHVGPHISHYPSASLAFFSSLILCISTLPQDIIKISSAQLVLFSFPLNLSTLITFAVEPFLASNPFCLFGGPGQCTINSSCNYHSQTENLVSCLIWSQSRRNGFLLLGSSVFLLCFSCFIWALVTLEERVCVWITFSMDFCHGHGEINIPMQDITLLLDQESKPFVCLE